MPGEFSASRLEPRRGADHARERRRRRRRNREANAARGACPPSVDEPDRLARNPHEGVRQSAHRRQAGVCTRLGLILYAALAPLAGGPRIPFAAGYGLVPVTILTLLLVAAQAVTAITSERDGRQLDLLLVTDLSPKEFIFGKLGGVLYNTKEYVLPPLLLAAAYAWLGYLATPPGSRPDLSASMNATALVAVWGAILTLLAFVLVLGVHVALRVVNSRQAVTNAPSAPSSSSRSARSSAST